MESAHRKILQIYPADNVLVALLDLERNAVIEFGHNTYALLEPLPAKHKFFIQDMQQGEAIKMYGDTVGKVFTRKAQRGQRMSVYNTKHAAEPYAYRNVSYQWQPPDVAGFTNRTFNGYHRKDGKVDTANFWLFIPTVFCENRNLDVTKEAQHQTP